MKYAIIGMGFIYSRHIKAIQDTGGEVVLTCDIDPTKNPDFTDWVEMYHSPRFKDVDCVVICTPNYLHGVMAREAVKLNKEVICEKPMYLEYFDTDDKSLEEITPILQLRYNPALIGLNARDVYVEAKMFRDDKYWNSWKGNDVKSGGILFNLGVHYIDILRVLLGEWLEVENALVTKTQATGKIRFENGFGEFHIEIVDDKSKQGRKVVVDGKEINLSNQENLSYEDLHKNVYQDFVMERGYKGENTFASLNLIHEIIKCSERVVNV